MTTIAELTKLYEDVKTALLDGEAERHLINVGKYVSTLECNLTVNGKFKWIGPYNPNYAVETLMPDQFYSGNDIKGQIVTNNIITCSNMNGLPSFNANLIYEWCTNDTAPTLLTKLSSNVYHEYVVANYGLNKLSYISDSLSVSDNFLALYAVTSDSLTLNQNVEPYVTLSDYLRICSVNDFKNLLAQVILALTEANQLCNFGHNNITPDNVLISSTNTHKSILYRVNNTVYELIDCSHVAKITDFSHSHITYEDKSYGRPDLMANCILYNRSYLVGDIYQFLFSSLIKLNEYNRTDIINDLRELISVFHEYDTLDEVLALIYKYNCRVPYISKLAKIDIIKTILPLINCNVWPNEPICSVATAFNFYDYAKPIHNSNLLKFIVDRYDHKNTKPVEDMCEADAKKISTHPLINYQVVGLAPDILNHKSFITKYVSHINNVTVITNVINHYNQCRSIIAYISRALSNNNHKLPDVNSTKIISSYRNSITSAHGYIKSNTTMESLIRHLELLLQCLD